MGSRATGLKQMLSGWGEGYGLPECGGIVLVVVNTMHDHDRIREERYGEGRGIRSTIREVIYEIYPVYFVSSLQNKFRGTDIASLDDGQLTLPWRLPRDRSTAYRNGTTLQRLLYRHWKEPLSEHI
jgi:hypothetical protein